MGLEEAHSLKDLSYRAQTYINYEDKFLAEGGGRRAGNLELNWAFEGDDDRYKEEG